MICHLSQLSKAKQSAEADAIPMQSTAQNVLHSQTLQLTSQIYDALLLDLHLLHLHKVTTVNIILCLTAQDRHFTVETSADVPPGPCLIGMPAQNIVSRQTALHLGPFPALHTAAAAKQMLLLVPQSGPQQSYRYKSTSN